jgi:hypothetical protein
MKQFRPLLVALFLTATVTVPVILTGCPGFGVQAPVTFNERAVATYKGIEAAADSAVLLLDAGKLSQADGQNVRETLQTAKTAVDVAVQLHTEGDVTGGDLRLQGTIAALTAVQNYLRSKQ